MRKRSMLSSRRRTRGGKDRRGAVVVLSALLMILLLGMVAFALDLGYLALAEAEIQRTADAAAMAAAWNLLDEDRLKGDAYVNDVINDGRDSAVRFASYNRVATVSPVLDPNWGNSSSGDLVFGHWSGGSLSTGVWPEEFNAAKALTRRNSVRNGPVPFFFARVLGIPSAGLERHAVAAFSDGVMGFRASERHPMTSLLPFTLKVDDWMALLSEGGSDEFYYDTQTHEVTEGYDGVPELKLYPAKENGGSGITPGNFGTIDFGGSANSTEVLSRQILEGVNADDLAYHGGEIALDPVTNTLPLNGETGMSIGMQHAVGSVVGEARTIPLYSEAVGDGNTTNFTIVKFAGIRIVDFDLHGNHKYILIQPAIVPDHTAITNSGGDTSYFVYSPVRLVD
jgi:hypothetical protein